MAQPNCDEDCDTDPDFCGRCGGEGYVYGEEIASAYDYGWIDEDGVYPCPECHHRRRCYLCAAEHAPLDTHPHTECSCLTCFPRKD